MRMSFFYFVAAYALCGSSMAQGPAPTTIFVPSAITVEPDKSLTLETASVAVPFGTDPISVIPVTIPVRTRSASGVLAVGMYCTDGTAQVADGTLITAPKRVLQDAAGAWKLETTTLIMSTPHGDIPAGCGVIRCGPERIPVVATGRPSSIRPVTRGPTWTIDYNPDLAQFAAVFPTASATDMLAQLDRSKALFETLLSACTGHVHVDVSFAAVSGSTLAAVTTTTLEGNPATTTDGRRAIIADVTGEPASEVDLYELLPGPYPVQSALGTATISSASNIAVPTSLEQHLLLFVNAAPDATTIINSLVAFDFNPANGFAPGTEDFYTNIVHETFHMLGFTSTADVPVANFISVWDTLRLSADDVPTTSTVLSTVPRQLRPTIPTNFATGINGPPFPASRGKRAGGDGFGASHWKQFQLLSPAAPVGIMDPTATLAVAAMSGLRITQADLKALDAIGWALEPADFNFAMAPSIPLSPPAAQLVTDTPTLTWDAGSGNDKWHLTVFNGATPSPANEVLHVENIFDTTFTIGGAQSLPSGAYSWFVIGENLLGFTQSPSSSFVVCTADFNRDHMLSVQDIFDFLNSWFSLCHTYNPPTCYGDADFNHSGQISPQDIFDFLNAWFAGC